jgi:hypothetical protein
MLIALGLINWRYQSGESDTLMNSLVIIAVGAIQLIVSFIPRVSTSLTRTPIKEIAWVISVAGVVFAIIN